MKNLKRNTRQRKRRRRRLEKRRAKNGDGRYKK